jgi:hypothetical protein
MARSGRRLFNSSPANPAAGLSARGDVRDLAVAPGAERLRQHVAYYVNLICTRFAAAHEKQRIPESCAVLRGRRYGHLRAYVYPLRDSRLT